MRVSGRVIHGTGAWRPRIERFPQVFIAHFGYPLFPGTLNVLLDAPLPVRAEFRIPGSEIGEPEQDMLFERCLIDGLEAFRLRPFQPATGAGGHGDHILEIVSPQELRPLLRDRDCVTVEFPARDDRPFAAAAGRRAVPLAAAASGRPAPMSTPARRPALRTLRRADAPLLADAFAAIGWSKPAATFLRYVADEEAGLRSCWVAEELGGVAGFVTVLWPLPCATGPAEIQDLNVLPSFRNRGIGTALLELAEAAVARRGDVVQIAVGLHRGYGAAQRLYVRRGYVPDGAGASIDGRPVAEGVTAALDDALVITMRKALNAPARERDPGPAAPQ